jgi:hypothetical protein
MQTLPAALSALDQYRQFVLFKLVPKADGKLNKIPVNPFTLELFPKGSNWQQDPSAQTDFATASANLRPGYGVGFLLTPNDPFFFLDIDGCLNPDGQSWSPLALQLVNALPGAAIEVSSSGKGLHIIGKQSGVPEFSNKNDALKLEFYTQWRFIALTGFSAVGSAHTDMTAQLPAVLSTYFPPGVKVDRATWTSEPVAEWNGPTDDDELIEKMLASNSAARVFGGKSNLQALWECDEDELGRMYPDSGRPYDESLADAALAQHLAFWTGNDCDRIFTLMFRSGLVRDKWNRVDDYLEPTILRAVALQDKFYCEIDTSIVDKFGAGRIDASSDAQRAYAEGIRAQVVSKCTDAQATFLCQTRTSAKFWLDNQGKTPDELVLMLKPLESVDKPATTSKAVSVSGWQYLPATLQIEKFDGFVYVAQDHKIFTPKNGLLDMGRFNAVHGGYVFQMDASGEKTTKKAWEAFTESQCVRFPKADSRIFKPRLESGAVFEIEGLAMVNTYVPVETPRVVGDVSPFLNHIEKLLPVAHDREILLAYMAACVQHIGIKFQWAPLIQGAPGNGKTLFTRCVEAAIGRRYSYRPRSDQLTSKFNDWLDGTLFIGVEDVYVTESKKEVLEILKPMITGGDGYEIEGKGEGKYTTDICCNFLLNSNHKDAIRKTEDDRRFAVFYTQQQTEQDILRDGMGGDYFANLYAWLDADGYAIINNFLRSYQIPDELNPATKCNRAPKTSSTAEAISMGLGSVEQEILEAVGENRLGFAGGWVSSVALDRLLKDMRADRMVQRNKRLSMMQSLGYDLHPALPNGRVNNPIQIDENKKPTLYIKNGHVSLNFSTPSDIAAAYVKAQETVMVADPKAAKVFGP